MAFFRRGYTVTTDRVRDKIRVRENGETLVLTVDEEAGSLVNGLNRVQKKLAGADTSTVNETAKMFAGVIFGQEQAAKLLDFYGGNPYSVIEVCGKYFSERLGTMITEKQKKRK